MSEIVAVQKHNLIFVQEALKMTERGLSLSEACDAVVTRIGKRYPWYDWDDIDTCPYLTNAFLDAALALKEERLELLHDGVTNKDVICKECGYYQKGDCTHPKSEDYC